MVMMMPAGRNSWLVHQSSLAVLPADTSGESRRNGRKSENFAYQYPKYHKGRLTCRKCYDMGPPVLVPQCYPNLEMTLASWYTMTIFQPGNMRAFFNKTVYSCVYECGEL
jgi:hypothetical protein